MEASVGVLFVEPRHRLIGIGRKLLEAATLQAERLTLLGVWAVAAERQTGLDVLYKKLGFVRSRKTQADFRFGPSDLWRFYELKFPLLSVCGVN